MYIKLPKENKMELIRGIQEYFLNEREEEIGELAATFLLDYMIKILGPYLYNQAIHDAQFLLTQRIALMEEDLEALKLLHNRD
jgi:uncharacterized protein (DUF2164 family)